MPVGAVGLRMAQAEVSVKLKADGNQLDDPTGRRRPVVTQAGLQWDREEAAENGNIEAKIVGALPAIVESS
jgi:hypothetical protein